MTEVNKCARADELVSYFYNEATTDERRNFEQHLKSCAACRDELAAFGEVHGAVRDWRAEIMQAAPHLALDAILPQHARNGRPATAPVAAVTPAIEPRRTAWAALREFFTLTPAWLRVGMVAASLIICALATLAVVNAQFRWDDKGLAFGTGVNRQAQSAPQSATPQTAPQVATVNHPRFTQADFDKLTAERDAAQRDLAVARKQLDAAQQQVATLNVSLTNMRTKNQTLQASLRTRNNQVNRFRRGANDLLWAKYEPDEEGLHLSDLLDEVSPGSGQPQVKHNER